MGKTMNTQEFLCPILATNEFRPLVPHYNRTGDFLSIFTKDEPYYAERVDDVLTVYLSMMNGGMIGCKLKGVSLLAKNATTILKVDDGRLQLRWLLLNAAGAGAKPYYYDVSDLVGGAEVSTKELLAGAA